MNQEFNLGLAGWPVGEGACLLIKPVPCAEALEPTVQEGEQLLKAVS